MTQAIYPNDPLVEQPVISESFRELANKVTAKYGLAPNDPIDWLYALEDMYNEGFNDALKQTPKPRTESEQKAWQDGYNWGRDGSKIIHSEDKQESVGE